MPLIAQPEALYADQGAQPCLETNLQPCSDGEGKVEASSKADSIKGNLLQTALCIFNLPCIRRLQSITQTAVLAKPCLLKQAGPFWGAQAGSSFKNQA